MRASTRHRLLAGAAWALLVGAVVTWALVEDVGPAEAATRLVDAIQGSAWGPLAFVAVYLVRPLIFLSAAVLTVAGGFLFGAVGGVALVLVASNGSALVAYGLARWLGAGRDGDGTGRLARWTRRLRERSFETVIVMRLLYLPYDLVSYLAGAVRIHPLAFLAGTAIGSAPATVAFVLAGASLESFDGGVPAIDTPVLVASGILLVAGVALAEILRRREGGRDAAA
ncbi:TVP38/TMEM64 family protein [Miltoncostaea oceani]|uniref:TVP38/TMEM64 family protein n=1 Tax=Miltoncostaea oceani TaxID=2843216 RepID=UPI001C3C4C80|nr:VTT domain-containing protein [Miltoncostaea oceani]